MPIKAVVFDAYGTLFDVASAARRAGDEPALAHLRPVWPEVWPKLAADWRRKQLEYTWLRAVMGEHRDFWAVTGDGLDWALEAQGLAGDAPLRARLMQLYRVLDAYPEAAGVLDRLRAAGIATAILSNGTPEMLSDAVTSARLGDRLDAVLSVESVGVYKPASAVYDLACRHFGVTREAVLFVSSNGWDAAGAAAFGFFTVWVNRAGDPMDRMGHPPHEMLADLTAIPDIAGAI